ncbi:otoancorin isoform X2 [Brienomyrus brachyistius]|uniref:otoancorin isoform X2 n=1 Tax=Brienomyrus brachyistius TaxID=42636 RepID=UPI0020B27304|nr:otoancorin isoform X2 [Brienomyrus brachyistius]
MLIWVATVTVLHLLAHGLAVLPQEPAASHMVASNESPLPFPPMPLDFKDKARKLMSKCLPMGHPPLTLMDNMSSPLPQKLTGSSPFSLFLPLLSSLPPPLKSESHMNPFNATGDQPSRSMNWSVSHVSSFYWLDGKNITERLMNCSCLLQAVEILKNTSDAHRCLLRAFVAPLAWEALVNGSGFNAQERNLLLWASKVLLQEVPLPSSALPAELDHQQLSEMMGVFNEVFESISMDQKVKIVNWVKQQINQNCRVLLPSGSRPPVSPVAGTTEPCLPGMWLSAEVMDILRRFLTLLPPSEFKSVPKEQLCPFVQSDQFRVSFRKLGDDGSTLGKTLLSRVKQDCFSKEQEFLQNLDKLGPLTCFYGDATPLNVSLTERLLPQLADCNNSDADKLRVELVKKLVSGKGNLSPQSVMWLGPAVSALPTSWLANLSLSTIQSNLPSLGMAKWGPAQAWVLANTLLQGAQSVSSGDLLSLGSVVRGVRSSLLCKVEAQGLLGSQGLGRLSRELSTLQKVALLDGLHRNISMPELVSSLPDGLLSQLSLEMLAKAGLQSAEQVRDRSWTRAQAAFIMSKILSGKLTLKELGKLGPAVQGVTCEMIDRTNQSDVMEMIQMLALNAQWLSRTQALCANAKLFYNKDGNFSNFSSIDVNSIPAVMLLELNPRIIASLPKHHCSHFLEKMAVLNMSSLPMKSPSCQALADKALSCLGRNLSTLSPEDISHLGSLVCALDVRRLSGLSPEAINASLLALAKCPTLRRDNAEAIFTLLKTTYGDPSEWTASTVMSLGPLLLLNESILTSLPSEAWVKDALINIKDSMPQTLSSGSPEVFPTLTDLSALHRKLFILTTGSIPARTKRDVPAFSSISIPTVLEIEDLGERNVYWSPAQLAGIPPQTFRDGVSTLGMVRNYSAMQLQALRNKTMEVWGQPGGLSEEQVQQLGCVTQSFLHTELQELNISSLDTLEMLSSCIWEQRQRTAVWLGFMNRTGCTPAKLGTMEIVGLGQFLCGLSVKEIGQLRPEACREALGALGRTHCPVDVAMQLKVQVLKAIGAPANWSAAQVNSAGNILATLNASELQSLNPSVLPFIQPSTIPLIPPAMLAMLSPSQLKALGPDNAEMVTEAQKQPLTSEQRASLGDTGAVSSMGFVGTPAVSLPQRGGTPGLNSTTSVIVLQLLLLFVLKYSSGNN